MDSKSGIGNSNKFILIISTVVIGVLVILAVYLWRKISKNGKPKKSKEKTAQKNTEHKSEGGKNQGKKTKKVDKSKQKIVFSHSWLHTTLKGHTDTIKDIDINSNGKYLASCSEDGTLLVWTVKEFALKNYKTSKGTVDFDSAYLIRWSPDTKAFLIARSFTNTIEIFRVSKKSDGTMENIQTALTFLKKHEKDIISLGVPCTGKYVMTCSGDTTMIIWDIKGEVLATVDTNLMNTYSAQVSPCGRYVAASGFGPDVKVWEVVFTKGGDFSEVKRAYQLKGHRAGVYHFAFNNDSTRMASVSRDGTWKIWDTKIGYNLGQEPYLIQTGNYDHTGPCKIAMSLDARAIVIATDFTVYAYSPLTGQLEGKIEDPHSEPICNIVFDPSGKYFITAGDTTIRVFNNVGGLRATIAELQEKKRQATGPSSLKERIQQQIAEAQAVLESIEQKQG